MFYFLIFFVIEVSTMCSQTTRSVFIYMLYMVIQIMLLRMSDQLAPPQRNITIHFMPHFWANYWLILGSKADFWALVFFSKKPNFWKYILNKKNHLRILGYFRALLKRSISNFGLQPLSSKCPPAWSCRHDFD